MILAVRSDTIVAILADHALRLGYEPVDGVRVPPKPLVTVLVVMSTIGVEAVRQFVTDDLIINGCQSAVTAIDLPIR